LARQIMPRCKQRIQQKVKNIKALLLAGKDIGEISAIQRLIRQIRNAVGDFILPIL
jgi:hypothetical protein